ncbi:tetratricopeptide repeat protein [Luteolibacter sp. GHJ8]|uniref:Tetratricopeptide repeat protein n=2 Tax=Luteolibacter rhizosphaerae TaxID=2989719 RepID=A0ABT3G130_9BACT|nr:tetratricopeptide repeat protein [Luteolibacter rhizosphaerae]
MSRVLLLMVAALLLAGCKKPLVAASDDEKRLEQINARFHGGDLAGAEEDLLKYTVEYPKSGGAWGLMGWVHLKKDDYENAGKYFDKALEVDPNWENAHVGKGAMYRELGDTERARKSYLQAIRMKPDAAEAYSSLLVIELMEGNYEKAVEHGEKGWSYRKDLGTIAANLSVAYHYTGDMKKRREFYDEAKKLGYANLTVLEEVFRGERTIGPGTRATAPEEP